MPQGKKSWKILQFSLLFCILFWPVKINLGLPSAVRYFGLFCLISGAVLVIAAARGLGLKDNFKSSLKPGAGGHLVRSGLYSTVRHPAYSGVMLGALGISLWLNDVIRIFLTLGLFIFFNLKTMAEEKWLIKLYPDYTEYKKKVRKKFVPWVF